MSNMANNNEVTTNEIMDFLQENVPTEEDLKEALKDYPTKEDLTEALGKQKLDILDHIDDKLANLKGDLIILMRKKDRKLLHLVEI